MELETRPTTVSGICYACFSEYEAGDYIAYLGEDVLCPVCIIEHRELNAA